LILTGRLAVDQSSIERLIDFIMVVTTAYENLMKVDEGNGWRCDMNIVLASRLNPWWMEGVKGRRRNKESRNQRRQGGILKAFPNKISWFNVLFGNQ
jgi:hypothetical protein